MSGCGNEPLHRINYDAVSLSAVFLELKWRRDEPYNERGSNSGVRPTRGRPILKIVCFLTGIPMAVGAAFMCVLSTFLPCFFYLDENFLYRESRRYLVSKITPDGATWRPCNSRLYGRLNFGCVWAFFSARLPSFPLSFNRNSFYSRYSWLSMAICVLSESTWPGCRPPRW